LRCWLESRAVFADHELRHPVSIVPVHRDVVLIINARETSAKSRMASVYFRVETRPAVWCDWSGGHLLATGKAGFERLSPAAGFQLLFLVGGFVLRLRTWRHAAAETVMAACNGFVVPRGGESPAALFLVFQRCFYPCSGWVRGRVRAAELFVKFAVFLRVYFAASMVKVCFLSTVCLCGNLYPHR